ncbi:class I SAM-dependent methyltransferase [Patescibacteria group bacterium]
MVKSKPWNWKISSAPWWKEPAPEIYPLLKRWQKKKFQRLLDLGCGIGRHAVLFAQGGFKVDACDLSQDGINKVNELAKQNKLNISTKVTDMLSLPYEDNLFDCLVAFNVIYHADDKGVVKTISEMKRVLKKKGEAFVTFNSKNSTSFKAESNKRLSENTVIKTEGNEAGIPHYYADKADVEKLVKDFKTIEFSYKEEYYPDYVGAHYHVLLTKV